MYDPELGRWFGIDKLTEIDRSISPYVFSLNNPLNVVDPDGRLVIFINGMHGGSGGKTDYWYGFDNAVMRHLNDHNSRYYDGALGGIVGLYGKSVDFGITFSNLNPDLRYQAGYSAGKRDFSIILSQLAEGETIKVITHSMGAVYGKGFIQALIDMGIDPSLLAFEADFAPFQPTKQKAVDGVNTLQFTNRNDKVANNIFLGSPFGQIEGASMEVNNDNNLGHSISNFWNQIRSLPQGKYRIENGQVIPD